jgi:hypothetical protein
MHTPVRGLIALAAMVAALVATTPAWSATFGVTQLTDAVDADTGDAVCDSDLGVAGSQCTLRAAIQQANASTGADQIALPAGVYLRSLFGVGEDASAFGDLDVASEIEITGVGVDQTEIVGRGRQGFSDRVFDVHPGASLTVSDLQLAGGNLSSGLTSVDDAGGAVRNRGNFVANRARLYGSWAAGGGGGLYNAGEATLIDSEVLSNAGMVGFSVHVLAPGGGVLNETGATLTLERSTVALNTAYEGTGIYNRGTATITQSTIAENRGDSDGGEAVIVSTSQLALRESTVAGSFLREVASQLVVNAGSATLERTILDGITGLGTCTGVGAGMSLGYNASNDGTCGSDPTDLVVAAGQLRPLDAYGGPTRTMPPQPGSAIVDAGGSRCSATDQRGKARNDGQCDIGSTELQPDDFFLSAGRAESVTIADEGDPGDSNVVEVEVRLDAPAPHAITVDWATADSGSGAFLATENVDYVKSSGSLVFPVGSQVQKIRVPVVGDLLVEHDEKFEVRLSNAVGATIRRRVDHPWIRNDDIPPRLDGDLASTREGDPADAVRQTCEFVLVLSGRRMLGDGWIEYWTADKSAVAGEDYVAVPTTRVNVPGSTALPEEFRISVPILGDREDEPASEYFYLGFTASNNITIGFHLGECRIRDDDPLSAFVESLVASEGNSGTTPARFWIRLNKPADVVTAVEYTTAEGTDSSLPWYTPAQSGVDFVPESGTVTFNVGQDAVPVDIDVIGDTNPEDHEYFKLVISSTDASIDVREAFAVIADDDVDAAPPTVAASLSADPNAAGWHREAVTVTITADDGTGSGVDSIYYRVNGAQPPAPVTSPILIDQEGVNTITFWAVDARGNASAESELVVRLDKTAPSIAASRSPAANSNGWNNEDVTAEFSASDGLSGLATAATGSHLFDTEGANQSASFSATDLAGNSAERTVGDVSIDKTDPSITAARSPAANASGWNKETVTGSYSASDALSGLADPASGDHLFSTEGAGQSRTFTVSDLAGNSSSASVSDVNVDKTAPSIAASRAPAANANGWNNVNVTGSYTASDALSGLADPASGEHVFSTDGAGQAHTFSVIDRAGNSASASVTDVSIDKTAPQVTIVSPEARTYAVGQVVLADYVCADPLSGLVDCVGTVADGAAIDTSAGSHLFAVNANDQAGNAARVTVAYFAGSALDDFLAEFKALIRQGRYDAALKLAIAFFREHPEAKCELLDRIEASIRADTRLTQTQKTRALQLTQSVRRLLGC